MLSLSNKFDKQRNMKNRFINKLKKSVSIVIFMTVLAVIFPGCNTIKDGEYEVVTKLSGGTNRASIMSPAKATVENGKVILTVEWSSENYDYMIVNNEKYLPVNESGNSVFEIPIDGLSGEVNVIADTVAMGTPHEIDYTISYSLGGDSEAISDEETSSDNAINKLTLNNKNEKEEIKKWINNHTLTDKLELGYAKRFEVLYYDSKYCMLIINGTDYYMLNGSGYSIPDDIKDKVTVIDVPLGNIDLVSQSTVDYFDCLDALDSVSFTSINANNSQNENITKLLNDDKIKYAGKYSAPDFEMLINNKCSLVIENTMITHTPDVIDRFKNVNIPVMIDYSSHETDLLGRMEWIKLYGLLCNKLDYAIEIFDEKEERLKLSFDNTDISVAYFYVSENGGIVIRKNEDYIVNMINTAGGRYIFEGNSEYEGTGQMTIQKEAFFEKVSDCDVLIYNSTINGKINSKEELISKCEVLKNTKAYREDRIYCTNGNIYLSVMSLPEIVTELKDLFLNKEINEYFYKIN